MSSKGQSTSPKKSARLAQKRKLREEGSGSSSYEDAYYFTPYAPSTTKPQSPKGPKGEPTGRNRTPPLVELSHSPTKGRKSKSVSPLTLSPPKTPKKSRVALSPVPGPSRAYTRQSSSSSPDVERKLGHKGKKPIVKPTVPLFNDDDEPVMDGVQDDILAEEKWLDAVEAGNLDEFEEELNKSKTPKMLTARQRAILEKKDHVSSGHEVKKEEKVMSQEMIKMKAEKSEKRRILAREKKEIDKKKTMDRLLKKQQTRVVKTPTKPKAKLENEAKVVFISRRDGNIVIFPADKGFPPPLNEDKLELRVPEVVKCALPGCKKLKKYTCSKSLLPLCSNRCYQTNLILFLNQSNSKLKLMKVADPQKSKAY